MFSISHTSSGGAGTRLPAVFIFWLSSTGAPNAVVSFFMILLCFVAGCLLGRSLTSGRSGSPGNGCHRERICERRSLPFLRLLCAVAHRNNLSVSHQQAWR